MSRANVTFRELSKLDILNTSDDGLVVWATVFDEAHAPQTLPYILNKTSGTEIWSTAGVALCIMVWTPIKGTKLKQLIVREARYYCAIDADREVDTSGDFHVGGKFASITDEVYKCVEGYANDARRLMKPYEKAPLNVSRDYIFGTHKTPWMKTTKKWQEVSSLYGYPCISNVTYSHRLWKRAVDFAMSLLQAPGHVSDTDESTARATEVAITLVAQMYNATAETTDDRKAMFMAWGTNGDCDDMAIAVCTMVNFLLVSDVVVDGSQAALCHVWIKKNVSKAVIVLGHAAGSVRTPKPGDGGGHCWAALLPLDASPTNLLSGARMSESTCLTSNSTTPTNCVHPFEKSPRYNLDPDTKCKENTLSIKPLNASQYMAVVYVLDNDGCWLVSSKGVVGPTWDECVTSSSGVSTDRLPASGSMYDEVQTKFGVPMRHHFDMEAIDAIWDDNKDELLRSMGLTNCVLDASLEGKTIERLGHVEPDCSIHTMFCGINFCLSFK